MIETNFDYVIVGAGSAGCVVAHRLTENGKYSVLLLEAGPKDNYPWIHIPIGYAKTMFNKKYNWCLHTEPDPGMYNRKIYWPRGKVLGGSSSINGLIFIRGQSAGFDGWEQLGNSGWGWNDVLPYFIRMEKNQRGESTLRGGNGPLGISEISDRDQLAKAFTKAVSKRTSLQTMTSMGTSKKVPVSINSQLGGENDVVQRLLILNLLKTALICKLRPMH